MAAALLLFTLNQLIAAIMLFHFDSAAKSPEVFPPASGLLFSSLVSFIWFHVCVVTRWWNNRCHFILTSDLFSSVRPLNNLSMFYIKFYFKKTDLIRVRVKNNKKLQEKLRIFPEAVWKLETTREFSSPCSWTGLWKFNVCETDDVVTVPSRGFGLSGEEEQFGRNAAAAVKDPSSSVKSQQTLWSNVSLQVSGVVMIGVGFSTIDGNVPVAKVNYKLKIKVLLLWFGLFLNTVYITARCDSVLLWDWKIN